LIDIDFDVLLGMERGFEMKELLVMEVEDKKFELIDEM
jgi:hypothetical protein